MNEGIPNCPDCGGKGMCLTHRVEYLQWVYETARDEYNTALNEYKKTLEVKVKQNEHSSDKTITDD